MSLQTLGTISSLPDVDGAGDGAGQIPEELPNELAPEVAILNHGWIDELFNPDDFHLQPYLKEDKGYLASESQNGFQSSCSPEFFRRIKHNLKVAMLYVVLGVEGRCEILDMCMTSTKKELLRLQQRPELFPSMDVEEDFWCEIKKCCDIIVEKSLPAREAHDEAERLFREEVVKDWQDHLLSARDVQRKPWEQFLHKGAPGSGADVSRLGDDGSVQILPMAASRIIITMLIEHNSIVQDIEELNDIFPKELQRSPEGNIRAIFPVSDLLPPALVAPKRAPRNGEIISLETLNSSFARLQRPGNAGMRRIWNCVSVVVRDRPFASVESQGQVEE